MELSRIVEERGQMSCTRPFGKNPEFDWLHAEAVYCIGNHVRADARTRSHSWTCRQHRRPHQPAQQQQQQQQMALWRNVFPGALVFL